MSEFIFEAPHETRQPFLVLEPIAEIVAPIQTPSNDLEGQVSSITLSAWEYEILNPFTISLEKYRRLSYEQIVSLQKEVRRLCSKTIEDAWKSGKRQIVIADNTIIFQTEEIEDIPNEKIHALAEEHKKPCYTFTAPDSVEESGWTMVDSDDHYPTLGLYIGAEDSPESNLATGFYPLDADFDTGNANLKVFDANQLAGELTKFDALDLRQAEHHDKAYTYFQKRVKICVKDEGNDVHSFVARVRLVKEWAGCGLLQYSPNRTGFVGRDMLGLLGVKVELDPTRKVTRILGSQFS